MLCNLTLCNIARYRVIAYQTASLSLLMLWLFLSLLPTLLPRQCWYEKHYCYGCLTAAVYVTVASTITVAATVLDTFTAIDTATVVCV